MDTDSLVASVLAAAGVLLIPYLLYRVARWARARATGAYVLAAALSPIIAAGSVVDPDSRPELRERAVCQPHNNGMQRTVRHKVPRPLRQRGAADAERSATNSACSVVWPGRILTA